jgi:hypothetical protein
LIDGGATHNFIDALLVSRQAPQTEKFEGFDVAVADGHIVECLDRVPNLEMKLGNYTVRDTFYVVDLSDTNVVLGVQWMITLGKITNNYQTLEMGFRDQDGKKVVLRGMSTGAPRTVSTKRRPPVFEAIPPGRPPDKGFEHTIELEEGAKPMITPPYHDPRRFEDEIDKAIKELLVIGHIRPSNIPFASSVVLFLKKDATMRMCIDYQALNKKTIKNRYPIPRIDELMDELHGVFFFSKIDLCSRYRQINIREKEIEKMTFRCHFGHFEFLVIQFGLTNAPATFQSCMNHIFRDQLRKLVLVFFDDILIYSRSWQEHMRHLDEVLSIMEAQSLYAKESKCEFGMTELLYLGHIISAQGVQVHQEKIRSILDWRMPKNMIESRSFFGLCIYYR